MIDIQVRGLDELINKFRNMPNALNKAIRQGMEQSLNILWNNVPPYPARPAESTYRRTGTLGRSLGVGESGGKVGKPTVYSITGDGINTIGMFGTNLNYAKYVIDPDSQAYMHKGRWWTMKDVKYKALDKIKRLWSEIITRALNAKI